MQSSLFETVPKPGKHGFYSERVCTERRKRIRVSVAAYAYEIANHPLINDSEFDSLAQSIDLTIKTGFGKLDNFFEKEFQKHTGQWIHRHPEIDKIAGIYNFLRSKE